MSDTPTGLTIYAMLPKREPLNHSSIYKPTQTHKQPQNIPTHQHNIKIIKYHSISLLQYSLLTFMKLLLFSLSLNFILIIMYWPKKQISFIFSDFTQLSSIIYV